MSVFDTANDVLKGAKKVTTAIKDAGGVGKAIKNLKVTWNDWQNTRDKVFAVFGHTTAKPFKPLLDAMNKNKTLNQFVPHSKVGATYDAEYKRLYDTITDTFINMGRKDLADDWMKSVTRWSDNTHPLDYAATLLKGAGSNKVVDIKQDKYSILTPFVPTMIQSLQAKGIAIPQINGQPLSANISAKLGGISNNPDVEALTQLFYNNFVAVQSNYNFENYSQIDFDNVHPGVKMNLDDDVIQATITYIKSLSDQKKAGKQLPKVLDKIAAAGNDVQEKLTKKAKNTVSTEIKNKATKAAINSPSPKQGSQDVPLPPAADNNKTMLYVGIAVVVIIVLFLVMKK